MGKYSKLLVLLVMASVLSSCSGLRAGARDVNTFVTEEETASEKEETSEGEGILADAESTTADEDAFSSGAVGDDVEDIEDENFYYAFTTLKTQEERRLYREILNSLLGLESETELSTRNQELLEPVFGCVLADHPEIFYVDGYTSTVYRLGNEITKITFSGDYTMDNDEINRRILLLEEKIGEWLAGVPDEDDYEKVKFLYDYLISHTEYELGSEDNQNICSVLLKGKSVCQGYAKTLQLLCQRLRIPALLVIGKTNGQGHAWNLIFMDGQWYHMDPTWGDASYRQEESGYPSTAYPAVNYDYFCVTTEQIGRTHELKEGQKLPDCTAVENQYYRREGLYLETADQNRIAEIFERAVREGAETVTFQCINDSVYDEVYELLIENQKIFDYLPDTGGKAAYADSPVQRTFSFWLFSEQ